MRIIDADMLFEEISHNDLSNMQQEDLVECIKKIIDKQPTVSKTIEIKNIGVFDNRKKYNK